ncbi:oligosaccharide flippase family protein [Roseivivax sediminis]|uniref:Membrane protein involved in the export of O-antigen and teichoic acid n=1 Tax=Roseivivax sediminis TaxID=936889 RepID=A0A1I1ULI1_9RHOB|nr:oligosaccharide flippase family protein [Roseivivax sediminis]SFD71722.1 Membrane protein involved in the export of O-antigen and teichoic acid [Roseivivax sediminis]
MIGAGPFARLRGTSLTARAVRSSLLSVGGFGTAQMLRLLSNLVLTRLLFPEAFGLMALVSVFMTGLQMFSDVGVTPAIMQSRRGDDRDFLDTAWTIQVMRGAALTAVAVGLAWPMAWVYDEPMLAQLLPVAGLTLLISGFNPTRLDTAGRHLLIGRVTVIEVVSQVAGLIVAIALAWALQSVWALVISGLVSAAVKLVLLDRFLPGARNRFRWEGPAATELITFGKWIFLSTVCGFLSHQGDKLIIGRYLPLDLFGVYNIGYFLASFPMLLGTMAVAKVLIPIYREAPPTESRANFLKLRKMRASVTVSLLGLLAVAALLGVWAVDLLYDPRYAQAGAVVVILALAGIPQIVALTYDQAALAVGDSRRFFVLALAKAVITIASLVMGLELAGLLGALVAQGVAHLAVYPVVTWLARRSGAWDPLHDVLGYAAGVGIIALALWLNGPEILALAADSG